MTKLLLPVLALGSIWPASCNPNPTPTPPPKPGHDCAAPARHSGLVVVPDPIVGRYIVVLKDRASLIQPLMMNIEGVTEVKMLRQGYAARVAAAMVAKLLADPSVQYVQEDGVKRVAQTTPREATALWGLDRIDQRDLPLDLDYTPGGDGASVNEAVVDTGVSAHPDFGGRLQVECFTAHGGTCADEHGHGTHVAGTIGGKKHGVAKKALLWAVRVLGRGGSGSDSDVIRGIEWVTAKKLTDPSKAWVINMSLGGGASPALDETTCNAIAAGVVVVVAAGNEGQDADRSSPARVRQAIAVGASDRSDRAASFSNFGTLLDLYAPGVDIESTQPGGGTAVFSGTSMAAPHVAGAAALVLAQNAGATPAEVEAGLVARATLAALAEPLPAGSPNALLYVRPVAGGGL